MPYGAKVLLDTVGLFNAASQFRSDSISKLNSVIVDQSVGYRIASLSPHSINSYYSHIRKLVGPSMTMPKLFIAACVHDTTLGISPELKGSREAAHLLCEK
jgi:hypothetical protein